MVALREGVCAQTEHTSQLAGSASCYTLLAGALSATFFFAQDARPRPAAPAPLNTPHSAPY